MVPEDFGYIQDLFHKQVTSPHRTQCQLSWLNSDRGHQTWALDSTGLETIGPSRAMWSNPISKVLMERVNKNKNKKLLKKGIRTHSGGKTTLIALPTYMLEEGKG